MIKKKTRKTKKAKSLKPKKKKILYLLSETGGGHRAGAKSLAAAVDYLYPNAFKQDTMDVFATASKFLNVIMNLYAPIIRYSPQIYKIFYDLLDDPRILQYVEILSSPLTMKDLTEAIEKASPDVLVSVHPLVNHLAARAIEMSGRKIPLVVVVMDPVTFHLSWITPKSDLVIVATQKAKRLAIKYRMPKDRIKIIGLPVHPRFYFLKEKLIPKANKEDKLFTVLLMGGGDGSGRMDKIINELEIQGIAAKVIIICGTNKILESKLRMKAKRLKFPLKIYGFTDKVPEIMAESDMIVTKAGPGSIAEAMCMDLPMIINSWIPGQEEGNVEFVKQENLGRVSKNPKEIVRLIKRMMHPKLYNQIKKNIKKARRPKAALDIAKEIIRHL